MFALAQTDVPLRKIVLFGTVHLIILAMTVILPAIMSFWTRRGERPGLARGLAVGLASLLIADRFIALAVGFGAGRIARWPDALPMHLCDWAAIIVIVALIGRRQLPYELAYFWGLAGTLQAIITPDIAADTPMILAISFFVSHCGIVVGALFLTWGFGLRPAPGAVWRAFGWSQFYTACAVLVNWLAHTNFGYFAAKPVHASLLDAFAPWPWYILEMEVMALVSFVLFYAPFWPGNRRRAAQAREMPLPAK